MHRIAKVLSARAEPFDFAQDAPVEVRADLFRRATTRAARLVFSAAVALAVWSAGPGAVPGAIGAAQAAAPAAGVRFHAHSLPGGGQPFAVLIEDLNGDGEWDLAVTSPKTNRVSIYLGRGDGSFTAPQHFPTLAFPRGIAAADFDRDGTLDLAVAATDREAVAVHAGKGDGTFAPARRFHVGHRPFLLIARDLNADSIPDVAVANEGGRASVLLGDGRGEFSTASYTADKWPSDVDAGDFDEDGHLDLAVTNWGANNVSILRGKGDGTFAAPRNLPFPGHAIYEVEAVDLDRDGHLDMVWNDIIREGLYVLYGDGAGGFPRTVLLPTGSGVRAVAIADLDGDGWLDLASADTAAGSTSIVLADGRGGFLPARQVPAGVLPRTVAAADLDGDGRVDLVLANTESDDVTVLLNQGVGPLPRMAEVGPPPDRGPLQLAGMAGPRGMARDGAGHLLVADEQHHRVVRIDPATGEQTVVAGTGRPGYSGDGAAAVAAQLSGPADVAVDSTGALYIADAGNNRIRKVDAGGTISTVAGTGTPGYAGYAGDGGPAAQAALSNPVAVAVDRQDALYIADFGNRRIRKVGRDGIIDSVGAGPGGTLLEAIVAGLAVDGAGNLLLAEPFQRRVRKMDASGNVTTVAGGLGAGSSFALPSDVAVDAAGAIYVADSGAHRIVRWRPSGGLETVAGGDEAGYSGDGGPATEARLDLPAAVALGADGALFFTERGNNIVRRVSPDGLIETVAGTAPDRPLPPATPLAQQAAEAGAEPTLGIRPEWVYGFRSGSDNNAAYAVAVGEQGEIYVAGDVGTGADWRTMRLNPQGTLAWQLDIGGEDLEIPMALALTGDGQIVAAGHRVTSTGRDYFVVSRQADGTENWRYERPLRGPQIAHGVAAGPDGNLYVAGESERKWQVFSLDPQGKLRWKEDAGPGGARAIAIDAAGNLLVAGRDPSAWRVVKMSPDGEQLWQHRERTLTPQASAEGIALDGEGNAVVTGSWYAPRPRLRVQKLAADGSVLWTYLDRGQEPGIIGRAVAVDARGNAIVVGETGQDWLLLSLDPQGKLRWRTTYDGGGKTKNRDRAWAVALHPAGGFVVSGYVHPVPPHFPSLGAVEWRVAWYREVASGSEKRSPEENSPHGS